MQDSPTSQIRLISERNNEGVRQATVIGFSQIDAEPYYLLLDVLGWNVLTLSDLSGIGNIESQLTFLDARSITPVAIAEAISVKPVTTLLAILVNAMPASDSNIYDRVEWLTPPFDIIAVERVIEKAS